MILCINPSCPNPENSDTQLFCNSCGSELLLEGRYRVIDQLGSGGFGKTYEVKDRQGSFKVLKVLMNTHNEPKYIELFQREAQVLNQLNHPGIPKVTADAYFTFLPYNNQKPLHCLVMEKIEGLDLQQYLEKRGHPIEEKIAIQWLLQLVNILKEVHSQNFFHRDIKPSNIMLRVDGQLVLIDFGTVRAISQTFAQKQAAGQVTGVISAGYTPLEQLNGKAVPQSDFFALGRTFVYLLTGKDPSNFYHSQTDELRWRQSASGIAPALAYLIDQMMARFPHQRPQTAEEIEQQLTEINRAFASTQVLVPPTQPLPRNQRASQSPLSANSTVPVPQIEPDFIQHCQQELAEFIGPISTIVCQRTLAKNPAFSATEFVDALAKQIPNQQQAVEFQQRLLS
ncbi:MAG: serine/threonine protein kinase [Symploca sp. SIO3E6]|nr:serine/threonine protein kinase [Caldora sp. SIO3E6]